MKVVDVQKRDVYFLTEYSKEEALYLKMILDHANIEYDSEKSPKMVNAIEYLHKTLYPTLEQIEKSIEQGDT